MSIENSKSREIIIAGSGIAAAATALRLVSLGFLPRLISLGRAITPGLEAIPEAAFPLIADLDLDGAVALASGKIVEGFENAWTPSAPILRPGRWLHVERSNFAAAAIQEAVARGARLSVVKTLPPAPNRCLAAVDATGRSAVWSRPIRRRGDQVADLFEIPSTALRGRIERSPVGWIYMIGTTVGVVSTLRSRPVPPFGGRYIGRRPAFPQWCENPVQGCRIAVGDAALSYDPLAGQGIRFALASAFAAASTIQTWAENGANEVATRFYAEFVTQARLRHLRFLEKLELEQPPELPQPLPEKICFCGRRGSAELMIESRIEMGPAILLDDRTAVRWLGGVDLLELEELTRKPVASSEVVVRLAATGAEPAQARAVLAWCLRKGVLQAITAKKT
jgi:hypothetical protein